MIYVGADLCVCPCCAHTQVRPYKFNQRREDFGLTTLD